MVYLNDAPFLINSTEPLIKYVTCTKDLKQGEAVFTEDVLVFGPNQDIKHVICLGCGINVDSSITCEDCGWPICNVNCDKLSLHRVNECAVFKKCSNMSFQRFSPKKFKFHQYECILPLRALFLKERYPDKWKYFEELKHDIDIRRDTATWQHEDVFVVKFIRQKCKLKQFDEELIHKVCSIIEVNCFQVTNSKNNLRCIYATSNYFSHSCVPNCTFVILPNETFRIYIRAAVDISKKELLTCSKVKPIMPTLLRRQELLHCAYLSCQCSRCADATELGSHLSSLKCPKCKKDVLARDPLDFESEWKCTQCNYQKTYNALKILYNEVEKELNKIKENTNISVTINMYETLMKKYASKLHANHAFMVHIKYNYLLQCLNGDTFHNSDYVDIEMKIKWLEELMEIFDIISPGYTCVRGTTIHMLYKAFVIKAKKYNTAKQDEQEQFTKYMTKALSHLDMAGKIMVVEKPFTGSVDEMSSQ